LISKKYDRGNFMQNLPENLITGVEAIDKQHLTLVITVENILDSLQSEYADEEISNLLAFLSSYTDIHFKTEEEYMIENNYEDYDSHKEKHDFFKMKIQTLEKSNIISSNNKDILTDAVNEAKNWIVDHVMTVDVKMAESLRK